MALDTPNAFDILDVNTIQLDSRYEVGPDSISTVSGRVAGKGADIPVRDGDIIEFYRDHGTLMFRNHSINGGEVTIMEEAFLHILNELNLREQ